LTSSDSPRVTTSDTRPVSAPADADAGLRRGSFVDELNRRIASLPFGGWWVYALLLVAIGTWATGVRWATGVAPVGAVDLTAITWVAFLPYYLAMLRYLDRAAERALETFAPALGGASTDLAFWRRELTTMAPRPAALAALAGALFGALLVAGTPPAIYLLFSQSFMATAVLMGWLIILSFATLAVVLYHTWHQLRAVRAIHAAATNLDPFRPAPLFAFSRLTAFTAVGLLLYFVYGLAVNGEFTKAAGPAFVNYLVSLPPALACFLIPLVGMHGRLVAAKSELLAETDARIRAATAALYRGIDNADMAGSGDARDALQGLVIVREQTAHLPTWPWSAQVFGGFVTALVLPIVIWFVTRTLGSFLSA
jgi:hypothetical protein